MNYNVSFLKRRILTLAFFINGLSLSAYAQTVPDNVYRVRIPGTVETCLVEAENLSIRFKLATEVAPIKTSCTAVATITAQQQEFPLYSLMLTYPGKTKLTVLTTKYGHYNGGLPGGANDVGDYYGIYGTYQSCLNDIPKRTMEFEKNTELKAVATYCTQAKVENTYVLNIESFGKQKKKLFTFDAGVWSKGKELENYLLTKDISIVSASKTRYFYYSTAPLNLEKRTLLSYQSAETCNRQLEVAKKLVNNFDKNSMMATCVPSGQSIRSDFSLVVLFSGYGYYKTQTYSEKYVSLDECLSDTYRVVSDFTMTGNNVFGALCSFDSISSQPEQFRMEVYSSR